MRRKGKRIRGLGGHKKWQWWKRSHNQNCILKINLPPLRIRDMPVIQHLKQYIENIGGIRSGEGYPQRQGRPAGSKPADWFFPLSRSYRCRQTAASSWHTFSSVHPGCVLVPQPGQKPPSGSSVLSGHQF